MGQLVVATCILHNYIKDIEFADLKTKTMKKSSLNAAV